MQDERNQNQIIRKDARECFVESLSDAFPIGRAHFAFATYDVSRPAGHRQTNNIQIYIEWLGGTSAEKLQSYGRSRADGKSLSRTAQLLPGTKADFLLVADSGPGETNAKGLIVPRFGNKPENHVAISMSFDTFSELMLMTRAHYNAWLSAYYASRVSSPNSKTDSLATSAVDSTEMEQKAMF